MPEILDGRLQLRLPDDLKEEVELLADVHRDGNLNAFVRSLFVAVTEQNHSTAVRKFRALLAEE